MDSEKEPQMYETAPEPMDPKAYDNLTEDQQNAMNDLLAQNPNMERAEALKRVSGPSQEADKEQ